MSVTGNDNYDDLLVNKNLVPGPESTSNIKSKVISFFLTVKVTVTVTVNLTP
jgi:hypothetical protein